MDTLKTQTSAPATNGHAQAHRSRAGRGRPATGQAIRQEENRQRMKIELIASENYVSPAVLEAQGSVLTNKYAEGYPGKRYYGGCEYVDVVETPGDRRGPRSCSAPTTPTCSPTPARRPTWPPIWPCCSRATRSWA